MRGFSLGSSVGMRTKDLRGEEFGTRERIYEAGERTAMEGCYKGHGC